jgi:hypothetical protein
MYAENEDMGRCIRIYDPKGDMGGCYPSILPKQRYRWTTIRPYAKLDDIGGLLSVYIAYKAVLVDAVRLYIVRRKTLD